MDGFLVGSGSRNPAPVVTQYVFLKFLHIFIAIGVPADQAIGPVRLSLGRATTVEESERAAELLAAAWRRLTVRVPA